MSKISLKKVFVEPQLTPQGSWQELTGGFNNFQCSGKTYNYSYSRS